VPSTSPIVPLRRLCEGPRSLLARNAILDARLRLLRSLGCVSRLEVHPVRAGRRRCNHKAIKQIELRRHFRIEAVATAIGMVILVLIWALSEYHNAGGWPTRGFSQSSGIHDVWNFWIVYPIGGLGLILVARAWFVYGNEPISESEIKREIERQAGARR
jgi:hypothetical protein